MSTSVLMSSAIAFTVPGKPQGKGRGRIVRVGAHARIATPDKTRAYESTIAMAAQAAMRGRALLDGAVSIELHVHVMVPASWSKAKRAAALDGALRPTTKPDVDNVLKSILDGCNGVVWRDDVQVTDFQGRKRYAETPCVRVWVAAADGATT